MTVYIILAAVLLLSSVLMAALFEPYKLRVLSFLTKISWDTVIMNFFAWACILFLRKLLYYIPLPGVILTKNAIWSIDKSTLFALCSILVFVLLLIITGRWQLGKKPGFFLSTFDILLFIPYICLIVVEEEGLELGQRIVSLFVKPLLLLKMACPGKYLGILVGVGIAYLFTEGRKAIPKKSAALKIAITVLFLSFGLVSYYQFSGGWESTLDVKLSQADREKGGNAFGEILEAVESIYDSHVKLRSYNRIAMSLARAGDTFKTYRIFRHSLDVILKEDFPNKSEAFKETVIAIVKVYGLEDAGYLCETEDMKGFLKKLVDTDPMINNSETRLDTFLEMAVLIAEAGEVTWVRQKFGRVIEEIIKSGDSEWKARALKKIALAIVKIGDTPWAEAVAKSIPDKRLKKRTLKEIQKK